jgi:hypothetical protein
MNAHLDRDDLLRLVDRLINETISSEEQDRLDQCLRAHP